MLSNFVIFKFCFEILIFLPPPWRLGRFWGQRFGVCRGFRGAGSPGQTVAPQPPAPRQGDDFPTLGNFFLINFKFHAKKKIFFFVFKFGKSHPPASALPDSVSKERKKKITPNPCRPDVRRAWTLAPRFPEI